MKTLRCALLIAASVVLTTVGDARDLKTVNGEVFKNIAVTKKDATGIQITHDDGVAFVDFKNLADAEQKEFGFDPAKYAAGQQEKIAAEKRRRELAAQRAAAAKAAAANAPAADPTVATGANPPARGFEFGVGTPGFKYGGYRIDGFGVTNGQPTGTTPLPAGIQGGYVSPPIIHKR